jgi:hypothetical protein
MARGQHRDKARIIRKKKGTRTEGGYTKSPQYGPWFRCFYDPASEDETRSDGGVRRRRRGATIETSRLALDGSLIEIKASDRIEVDSRRFGTVTLDVTDTPERMVRGRTWLGWSVPVGATNRTAPG